MGEVREPGTMGGLSAKGWNEQADSRNALVPRQRFVLADKWTPARRPG